MDTIKAGGNDKIVGYSPSTDFSAIVIDEPTINAASTVSGTDKDLLTATDTTLNTDNDFRVSAAAAQYGDVLVVANKTPAVIGLDGEGKATRVADGTAIIEVSVQGKGLRRITREIRRLGEVIVTRYPGFVASSLADHVEAIIAGYELGKTPTTQNLEIYDAPISWSKIIPTGTRNAGIWCAGLDFSASTFASASSGGGFPAQLISPRHVIMANHVAANPGTKLIWLDNSNVFHSATVQSKAIAGTDVAVGYLDAPIPSTITPFYFLPENYQTYLPSLGWAQTRRHMPAIYKGSSTSNSPAPGAFPQAVTTAVMNIHSANINYTESNPFYGFDSTFSKGVIGGDSGSPVVFPVNDGTGIKPVLLCSLYTSQYAQAYVAIMADIEAAMNSLAAAAGDVTAYILNRIDLTGFTAY